MQKSNYSLCSVVGVVPHMLLDLESPAVCGRRACVQEMARGLHLLRSGGLLRVELGVAFPMIEAVAIHLRRIALLDEVGGLRRQAVIRVVVEAGGGRIQVEAVRGHLLLGLSDHQSVEDDVPDEDVDRFRAVRERLLCLMQGFADELLERHLDDVLLDGDVPDVDGRPSLAAQRTVAGRRREVVAAGRRVVRTEPLFGVCR